LTGLADTAPSCDRYPTIRSIVAETSEPPVKRFGKLAGESLV
jgi:hypothetical protein